MHRLGEIRDRGLENQSYRASGLTLLTAAITLWNTVYIERAIESLKRKGIPINEQLISHLSPLGWEHINLSGDYVWRNNLKLGPENTGHNALLILNCTKSSLGVGCFPFSMRTPDGTATITFKLGCFILTTFSFRTLHSDNSVLLRKQLKTGDICSCGCWVLFNFGEYVLPLYDFDQMRAKRKVTLNAKLKALQKVVQIHDYTIVTILHHMCNNSVFTAHIQSSLP